MNYYNHHIGDYAKDTAHLSMQEDGAYRRMLDLYYSTERAICKERPKLYRLLRAGSKLDRQTVDAMLAEFFYETPDGWHHKRCDAEILKAQEKSGKAKQSADMRWQSERNANASTKTQQNAMRTHSEGNAPNSQEPIASNQEKSKEIPPSAGAVAPDPLFGVGLEFLQSKGVPEKSARSFLGLLRKEVGEAEAFESLEKARSEDVSEPIAWLTRVMKAKKANGRAPPRSKEADFSTLNYREGISEDGRF